MLYLQSQLEPSERTFDCFNEFCLHFLHLSLELLFHITVIKDALPHNLVDVRLQSCSKNLPITYPNEQCPNDPSNPRSHIFNHIIRLLERHFHGLLYTLFEPLL